MGKEQKPSGQNALNRKRFPNDPKKNEKKEEIRIWQNSKEEILRRSSDEVIAMAIRDVLIREREKREKQ